MLIFDDGRYLFVMNLFDKTVYRIDLVDPFEPTSATAANVATRISSWGSTISPVVPNGEHRPLDWNLQEEISLLASFVVEKMVVVQGLRGICISNHGFCRRDLFYLI